MNEGTPVSIIEAMAASTPVIATDAGGVSDLLGSTDGTLASGDFAICTRGILCGKEDPVGFSKGLAYLMEMDVSKREALITKSRDFVKQKFSEERLLEDMEALYLELVEKQSIKAPFQENMLNRPGEI